MDILVTLSLSLWLLWVLALLPDRRESDITRRDGILAMSWLTGLAFGIPALVVLLT